MFDPATIDGLMDWSARSRYDYDGGVQVVLLSYFYIVFEADAFGLTPPTSAEDELFYRVPIDTSAPIFRAAKAYVRHQIERAWGWHGSSAWEDEETRSLLAEAHAIAQRLGISEDDVRDYYRRRATWLPPEGTSWDTIDERVEARMGQLRDQKRKKAFELACLYRKCWIEANQDPPFNPETVDFVTSILRQTGELYGPFWDTKGVVTGLTCYFQARFAPELVPEYSFEMGVERDEVAGEKTAYEMAEAYCMYVIELAWGGPGDLPELGERKQRALALAAEQGIDTDEVVEYYQSRAAWSPAPGTTWDTVNEQAEAMWEHNNRTCTL